MMRLSAINAQLNGTLDANIVNIPGMTIENGPDNPVPVIMDGYIRVPFRAVHGNTFQNLVGLNSNTYERTAIC